MSKRAARGVEGPDRKRRKRATAVPIYAVFHETNFAMCMAGGFIGPRSEEAAAVDHHARAGGLVLEAGSPSISSLRDAKGDLPYGGVVVVQIDAQLDLDCTTSPRSCPVLPLATVRRAVFPSLRALQEFEARASSYGDIPPGVVRLEVDESIFVPQHGAERGVSKLPMESHVSEALVAETPARYESTWTETLDRSAGTLAALFSTIRLGSSIGLLEQVAGLGAELAKGDFPLAIPLKVARLLDPVDGRVAFEPLLMAVAKMLLEKKKSDSVNAKLALGEIRASLTAGGELNEPIEKFLGFAEELAALRRELPATAYSDMDGSVIPRAVLLCLFNPDPDRLVAIRARLRNLGPRVYCLAATLLGLGTGMSSLGNDLKSGDKQAFLAIPSFVLAGASGIATATSVCRAWSPTGDGEVALHWDKHRLASVTVPPDPVLIAVADAARNMGMKVAFSSTAPAVQVSSIARADAEVISCRVGVSPVFPRRSALELMVDSPDKLGKQDLRKRLTEIGDAARETGLFASVECRNRATVLRLHSYLEVPFAEADLATVLDQLWAAVSRSNSVPEEKDPVEPDLFGADLLSKC